MPYNPHIITKIKRWWQSFGFGVQSKTDFSFLHDVIKEQNPYYIYEELLQHYPNATKKEIKTAQLLFRIANHFHPSEIKFIGNVSQIYREHISAATKGEGGIIIVGQGEIHLHHLHGITAAIITDINDINTETWQKIMNSNAITYDMTNLGIAINYKNRSPQHYAI